MAKTVFTEQEAKIWAVLAPPSDPNGLSNAMRQNLAHRIGQELNLYPVLTRNQDTFSVFETSDLVQDAGRKPNGTYNVYYLAQDCEDATGSAANNWTQWAAAILDHGRDSHPLAPRLYPPGRLLEEMETRKLLGRTKVTRFLSIEIVAFYLAAQTTTWERLHAVSRIKNRINAILSAPGLSIPIPPEEDDVNAADIFPQSTAAKTKLPQAGRDLQQYNPTIVRIEGEDPGAITQAIERTLRGPSKVHAIAGGSDNLIAISDDLSVEEMEARIQQANAMLQKRREEALAANYAQAGKFKVVRYEAARGSTLPHTLLIRMESGEEITFVNPQIPKKEAQKFSSDEWFQENL